MIVSKTPFRMSFVGGGTDLPWFYREEMGAVVSTTIDKYMYIALNRKFDDRIRISYSRTEEVETAQQVEHPLVRHALGVAGINGGIEVASMADIPSRGTGLGSSSSYTVGLLNAFFAYRNEYASKERLAQLACEIEIERCGEPIGKQDQYAAAYGGLNLIRFHPDESVSVDPVICDPAVLAELEASTLVFYTGRARSASAVLAEQYAHADANRPLMRRMVASGEAWRTVRRAASFSAPAAAASSCSSRRRTATFASAARCPTSSRRSSASNAPAHRSSSINPRMAHER